MNVDDEVWDRRAGESEPAFEAFRAFLNMKRGERSITGAARLVGKNRRNCTRWSGMYSWRMRVDSFDRQLDREWEKETMSLRREAAQEDIKIARALLGKVAASLQHVDAETMTINQIGMWFKIATEARRIALGGPTERVEHSGPNGGAIPLGELTPEDRRSRLEQLVKEGQRRLRAVPDAS